MPLALATAAAQRRSKQSIPNPFTTKKPIPMATNSMLLGFLYCLALSSSWRPERHHISNAFHRAAIQTAHRADPTSADLQIRAKTKTLASKPSYHAPNNPYLDIVTIAQKEIGTREAAVPNTGKKVSEYLRYTGIKIPAPWCAAWLSYVFGQAGYPAPKTAWSPDLFPAARQVQAASTGCILGIYYASLKRIGHCGIVERIKGDWCMSIEGNTSALNEREGDGVWRKTRHKRSIRYYADWIKGQTNVIKKGGKP